MSKRHNHLANDKHRARSNQPGAVLELPSGYSIRVTALPPYYMDIIDAAIPMPEYPKRAVKLLAGDTVYMDYTPPEQPVQPDDEDYDLYTLWLYTHTMRQEADAARRKSRLDFLLATCVEILDGPKRVDDTSWVTDIEAAFDGFSVPNHPGKRKLIFLKAYVITSPEWMEAVMRSAITPEVNMQSVVNALQSFQHNTRT